MSEQPLDSKNTTSDTGLTASRDVSIGDVTGQLAIGKYINQFMIKEPSGEELVKLMAYLEQKRKEAANLGILNSYSPSVLPDYPPHLKEFVTRNRVEELNKALKYLQDHHILLFTGISGVGKTTLARALIDIRPANVPIPFWFDFRQNEDAKVGDILEKLAAYTNSLDIAKFREEKREAEEKDINKLTDKLKEREPVWLIFDNLETILDGIYFHDKYMDLLFTYLHNSTHQAKIIITSRTFPRLKNGDYLIDVIEEEKQNISGLKINFAVDYLVKNGLGNLELDKLKELAEGVDGHPLALKLLIGLVKKFGASDTLNDLTRYQKLKENTIKKARNLFGKLAGNEKELLERISVYRQAVTMNAIKKMFTENTPIDALDNLIDKSLLETDHKGNYWLHPLVQEFAYSDLKNKKEAHMLAVTYYLSLPLPEHPRRKEDVQSLIEAHHHACMAEEYEQAFNIIFDNNLNEYLDLWGNYAVLIEIYSKLLPKNPFGNEIYLKDKNSHGSIIGNIGLAYHQLGEVKKAVEHYERALQISKDTGDKHGEGIWLGNLGNAYSFLGEFGKAIEYQEQTLKISREAGNKLEEGNALGNLGNEYLNLGEPGKAIEYYEQALQISKEIGDRLREELWLANIGNTHNYLGKSRKAIEYYEMALKISREVGDRRREGMFLGSLGVIYRDLGELKKATEYLQQALKISREIKDRIEEGVWLGNLGNVYHDLDSSRKAIEHYEKALKISREVGDRVREGTWLGNIGNEYIYLGDPKKAIEYYVQALDVSREIGDRLREGVWLGNLGNAYRDQGELEKAIEYYEQALKIAREIDGRREEGSHLGNLGLVYSYLGEPRKTIEYLKHALKISKEVGDRLKEGTWLGNLGIAYSSLGNPKKAIEYYIQALKISKETEDRFREGIWLESMGSAYSDLGETRKAIEYYEQALVIYRDRGDRLAEGNAFGNLGDAYYQLGEVKKAIEYYEQALKISKEIGSKDGEGMWLETLGLVYSDLGETRKAIEYYIQELRIAEDVGNRQAEGNTLMGLGDAYYQLGEAKKAIEYYEQALFIGKEIEDPKIINFCEKNLEALKSSKK